MVVKHLRLVKPGSNLAAAFGCIVQRCLLDEMSDRFALSLFS